MIHLACILKGHDYRLDHECTVLCEHLFGMNRGVSHCNRCNKRKEGGPR